MRMAVNAMKGNLPAVSEMDTGCTGMRMGRCGARDILKMTCAMVSARPGIRTDRNILKAATQQEYVWVPGSSGPRKESLLKSWITMNKRRVANLIKVGNPI